MRLDGRAKAGQNRVAAERKGGGLDDEGIGNRGIQYFCCMTAAKRRGGLGEIQQLVVQPTTPAGGGAVQVNECSMEQEAPKIETLTLGPIQFALHPISEDRKSWST